MKKFGKPVSKSSVQFFTSLSCVLIIVQTIVYILPMLAHLNRWNMYLPLLALQVLCVCLSSRHKRLPCTAGFMSSALFVGITIYYLIKGDFNGLFDIKISGSYFYESVLKLAFELLPILFCLAFLAIQIFIFVTLIATYREKKENIGKDNRNIFIAVKIIGAVAGSCILIFIEAFINSGLWKFDSSNKMERFLEKKYSEDFVINGIESQAENIRIYSVSPADNPDVVFYAGTGWYDGSWDVLLPFYSFPSKRSNTDNYASAVWLKYTQENSINTSVTEDALKNMDYADINGEKICNWKYGGCDEVNFTVTKDNLMQRIDEIYEAYCELNELKPFCDFPETDEEYERSDYARHSGGAVLFVDTWNGMKYIALKYPYTKEQIYEKIVGLNKDERTT